MEKTAQQTDEKIIVDRIYLEAMDFTLIQLEDTLKGVPGDAVSSVRGLLHKILEHSPLKSVSDSEIEKAALPPTDDDIISEVQHKYSTPEEVNAFLKGARWLRSQLNTGTSQNIKP